MMQLERLENRLGYAFGDRRILLQALTHRSYGHEQLANLPPSLRDNERLEFLGDAILDVIVSDILLEMYPDGQEGKLSKLRAAVVNEKTLAEIARSIGIGEVLRLGKGETQMGGHLKASILSSTFEALIAAMYLDGGFQAVFPVIRHLFSPLFSEDQEFGALHYRDYKTLLQESIQGKYKITPSYVLLETRGPDHSKTFLVEVRIGERRVSQSSGPSKKEAEQNAAREAFDALLQEWSQPTQ